MKIIGSVYKIGHGPSSSHTVGPYRAAVMFGQRYPDADEFRVTLYGSLALTGEGHSTAKAIMSALPNAKVKSDRRTRKLPHPNTMLFEAVKDGRVIKSQKVMSVGGGQVKLEGESSRDEDDIYELESFGAIAEYCREKGLTLNQYIAMKEPELKEHLRVIWQAMRREVEEGLKREGELPGELHLKRKAKLLYEKRCYNESADVTMNRLVAAYAYAASEQNASEAIVVTAPTCGACGVIPAVFYYMQNDRGFPEEEILDALAVAGLLGNLIRTNASISGAECGCQAEIGSACSMAAGGLAALYKLSTDQIEYAAEIAMEHNLGLTCDPICGLVQIPCIERNAVAAMRAMSAVNLSRFLFQTRKISFDEVISTMYRTGKDMNVKYRETSHGGLAEMYHSKTDA
ncbi:MAG: L-serine ammonia-lyase, iron-sulfur-dependent, subunit alpha [Clostridia bacterium]|nr:L-serine ammonia-lyase, iron-sulfur-dependent, subunit alpha [Clostridia bacterium]MCR4577718.1 L-serine ammonia-lyase, iron-sulfur-dependent, subunit alpha [Clostridiales bacterium]